MTSDSFKAFVVREQEERFTGHFEDCLQSQLPQGDVTIQVHYTSLNYKDTLSASGHKGITRSYPHVPGVDAVGSILESSSDAFTMGDHVIVTGYDLGMNTWGGFSEVIRVPSSWVVPLPKNLSMPEAMTIGTAGFTAAQAALRFQEGDVTPDSGPILVTGASGGVGSCAVALLSHLGYEVMPASRDPSKHDAFFQRLGAKTSCSTESINEVSPKPLLKSKWGGVVDTVGGKLLENAIKSTHRRGTIAFCGMIASSEINTTVFPFILRGIRLVGIDSAECPLDQKKDIWKKLSGPWKAPALQSLMELHPWESIPDQIEKMKSGNTQGRIVFKIR